MQQLRNAKFITRLVLVWFALFLGSAIASAIVKPGDMQMVCSVGGGMKMVDSSSGSEDPTATANLDCPLCASVTPPLIPQALHFLKPSPLAHALQPLQVAHIASITLPPLPSRGPPTFL
jgi:hypothetical protein